MAKTSLAVAAMALTLGTTGAATSPSTQMTATFRTATVDGVKVFYREAGPKDAPTLLLLHGFPASSRQFATLIPLLADRYHVIAPDYPGFGQSEAPRPSDSPTRSTISRRSSTS